MMVQYFKLAPCADDGGYLTYVLVLSTAAAIVLLSVGLAINVVIA